MFIWSLIENFDMTKDPFRVLTIKISIVWAKSQERAININENVSFLKWKRIKTSSSEVKFHMHVVKSLKNISIFFRMNAALSACVMSKEQ